MRRERGEWAVRIRHILVRYRSFAALAMLQLPGRLSDESNLPSHPRGSARCAIAQHWFRHSRGTDVHPIVRRLCASASAVTVGFIVSCCASTAWRFATGELRSDWTLVTWGDHWALRGVSSLIGFGCAAFVAGSIARMHGPLLALFGSMPSLLVWGAVTWLGTREGTYVPIGYRFTSVSILLIAPYTVVKFARWGQTNGAASAAHFDSRPRSVLGIAWYHYFWMIPYAYVVCIIVAGIVLPLLSAIRTLFQRGLEVTAIIPALVAFCLAYPVYLCLTGAERAYLQLAGFVPRQSAGRLARDLFLGPLIATLGLASVAGIRYLLFRHAQGQ